MKHLVSVISMLSLTGCVTIDGRTTYPRIHGPGWILNDIQLKQLKAVPGVLSVGDENYEQDVYVQFYPSTGEKIASGPFKRDYAPDFGAITESKTYTGIISVMSYICKTETAELRADKSHNGPTYTLIIDC